METTNSIILIIFKKSSLFFLSFILLIILFLGFISLIVFVVLKPQNPIFSIQTAKLDSYKLDVIRSSKDLVLSSLVSFTLNTSNPNRFALSFASSRLHVLENGTLIGMIKVPRFHQPPRSKNISLEAKVIVECLNVNKIMNSPSYDQKLMHDDDRSPIMRVLGDIGVKIRVFRVTLPKLRIALDCGITMDKKHVAFSTRMIEKVQAAASSGHILSLPTVSQLFSKKCSFAVYI